MNQRAIREGLALRWSNIRRHRSGIWSATDPRRGTIISRRQRRVIAENDEQAEQTARFYAGPRTTTTAR